MSSVASSLGSPTRAYKTMRSNRLKTAQDFSDEMDDELNSKIYQKYSRYPTESKNDLAHRIARVLDFCKSNCRTLVVIFTVQLLIVGLILDHFKPMCILSTARTNIQIKQTKQNRYSTPLDFKVNSVSRRTVDRLKLFKISALITTVLFLLSIYYIRSKPMLKTRLFDCSECSN